MGSTEIVEIPCRSIFSSPQPQGACPSDRSSGCLMRKHTRSLSRYDGATTVGSHIARTVVQSKSMPTRAAPIWRCKDCDRQFSVTSGTIFHSRKLAIRDYLAAIAIFVNAVKGVSALQLGRDLDVQYKTAFVLAHKIREAMGAGQIGAKLSGTVEI